MSKIAVILPVYKNDNPDFLKKSLDSIGNQTFRDFTLFVCKDGPLSKKQNDLINNYNLSSIKIVESKKNIGLASILNLAIKTALLQKYIYVARIDADDICYSDRFMMQYNLLEENNDIDLTSGWADIINEKGEHIGIKKVSHLPTFKSMIKSCDIVHPAAMFRSSFFKKYGFYDTSFVKAQDYELWLRALSNGAKFMNIQKPLIQFRYEFDIIKRRKSGQKYNIKIKRMYLSGIRFLGSSLKHIFILYCPSFLLSLILKFKIKHP